MNDESSPGPRLVRRLRISGILVGLGLTVEAVTLVWSHPTAFLAFLCIGGAMVGAGVLTYLASLVST
jgi:hypothetical protein